MVQIVPQSRNSTEHSYFYHGAHEDGRIRIKHDGLNALVCGVAYEVYGKQKASGKQQWLRKLVATTPGYKASASQDQSFIARSDCGARYRVIGQVQYLKPKQVAVQAMAPAADSLQSVSTKATVFLKQSDATALHERKQRASHAYMCELASIAAQRAAGLDPDLRMSFITAYVGESRANLYRKMGTAFPKPIKRGKGSFWPMSQIDTYKAGKYQGEQQ